MFISTDILGDISIIELFTVLIIELIIALTIELSLLRGEIILRP